MLNTNITKKLKEIKLFMSLIKDQSGPYIWQTPERVTWNTAASKTAVVICNLLTYLLCFLAIFLCVKTLGVKPGAFISCFIGTYLLMLSVQICFSHHGMLPEGEDSSARWNDCIISAIARKFFPSLYFDFIISLEKNYKSFFIKNNKLYYQSIYSSPVKDQEIIESIIGENEETIDFMCSNLLGSLQKAKHYQQNKKTLDEKKLKEDLLASDNKAPKAKRTKKYSSLSLVK